MVLALVSLTKKHFGHLGRGALKKIWIGMLVSFFGGLKFGHMLFWGLLEIGGIFLEIYESQCHFWGVIKTCVIMGLIKIKFCSVGKQQNVTCYFLGLRNLLCHFLGVEIWCISVLGQRKISYKRPYPRFTWVPPPPGLTTTLSWKFFPLDRQDSFLLQCQNNA